MISVNKERDNARKQTIAFLLAIMFIIGAFIPLVKSDINDPWWNADWLYRKQITIDHTKVAADLTNFPVLIHLIDSDLLLKAQSDGDDIVFTNQIGVKLNHEFESYNNVTGELIAWVNTPVLSSTQDTILYIYYGNTSCSNQQNPTAVWDSNFVMVHHLQATQGTHYDSTAFGNNGVPQGALNQNSIGKIDGADEFDGSTSYIDCGKNPSLNITNQITVSAWVKADVSRNGRIASKHGPSAGSFGWMLAQSWGRLEWRISTTGTNWNGGTTSASSFPVGSWC